LKNENSFSRFHLYINLDEIRWAKGLPKTRSEKIMRRLLRELATSNEIK